MPFRYAVAVLFTAMATPALAGSPPLQVTTRMLVEHRAARPDGTVAVEQVPATRAVPGDLVTVVVSYRNTGAAALGGLAIANPVPRGLVFRAVGTPGLALSIDGARFAPLPALAVRLNGGATRPARADDVTAVRWQPAAPLAPGAAGQFSFTATVK